MAEKHSILEEAKHLAENCLPHVAVDCVVFGYHEKQLKVLCTHITGVSGWILTGGFVEKSEDLDAAAERVVRERTCLDGLFLKQFKTFGSANRFQHTREDFEKLAHLTTREITWLSMRFISIGYYALTEFSKVNPQTRFLDDECVWFDIHKLPGMAHDHKLMVMEAFRTLRLELHHQPVGLNLLPEKFTLPELQALYETILKKKLDQRNFTKKLTSLNLIRKLKEKKYIGGHRPPSLYKFNKKEYTHALKHGIELAF